MGVKWKISLSFKGIIDMVRSAIAAGGELWEDMCQGLTHNGVRLYWKGVKETNDVVEMVESSTAALRVLDHETRGTHGRMPVMRSTAGDGEMRLKKVFRAVNSPIPYRFWQWSRRSIDHDPHIITFDAHWIAADLPIGIGETLARGDVEGPEVPGATDDLALDGTLADGASTMRAFIVDSVDCVLQLKERDELATDLYYLAVIAGNFSQRCHLDPFICHTGLLKKYLKRPAHRHGLRPRACPRTRPSSTNEGP